MVSKVKVDGAVRAPIGFALGDTGDGVAYSAIEDFDGKQTFARVAFHCVAMPALEGRDVAYAALLAMAQELRRRGYHRVAFEVDFEPLVLDLSEHRPVPATLAVPYVMLGCALNRFSKSSIALSRETACRDLTARARAEVSLHIAA